MLIITITVDTPGLPPQGVKEALAMYLEKFGDSRVISVEEKNPEQLSIYGGTK